MAEIRKRDRLLAEEKKIAREREAEGDQFADKEVFMTEAYVYIYRLDVLIIAANAMDGY